MTTHLTDTPTEAADPGAPAQTIQDLWREEELARRRKLIALIESWDAEDAAEDPAVMAAEWEVFKQALDEDRPSYRKLFS